MDNLSKALQTKWMLSIAYHPQTDSQMERINQEVKVFLLQNKLLTCLWYLNLRYTLRGLGVI